MTLIKLIDELAEKDIGFKAINSPMDTTTPAGRAFLQIQAAFAEMGVSTENGKNRAVRNFVEYF